MSQINIKSPLYLFNTSNECVVVAFFKFSTIKIVTSVSSTPLGFPFIGLSRKYLVHFQNFLPFDFQVSISCTWIVTSLSYTYLEFSFFLIVTYLSRSPLRFSKECYSCYEAIH